MFNLDNTRNGVHPSVTAPTDPAPEQLGGVRGRGSAGGSEGHAAPAEGSGPNPHTGIQHTGERLNEHAEQERKCKTKG